MQLECTTPDKLPRSISSFAKPSTSNFQRRVSSQTWAVDSSDASSVMSRRSSIVVESMKWAVPPISVISWNTYMEGGVAPSVLNLHKTITQALEAYIPNESRVSLLFMSLSKLEISAATQY